MSDRIGAAYRWLLRVYPRGARRAELEGTLLDAGRGRPTVRESMNLIRHGLRARLGYPRGGAVVVLVFLVGLAGAYFGGAAGHRLGWQFAPPMPSGAAAEEITATVFPGLKVWGGGDADVIVGQSDGEGIEYGYVTYWLRHTDATRDLTTYATGARERLIAAGWRVHDYTYQPPEDMVDRGQDSSVTFWAERPGLVLGFEQDLWTGMPPYDADGGNILTLRRQEPPWLGFFAWPGAVLGFAVAWLLAAWTGRRFWTAGVPGGVPGVVAGLTLVLLLPSALLVPVPDSPGQAPWWAGLGNGITSATIPVLLAVIMLIAAVLIGPNPLRTAIGRHPRLLITGAALVAAGVLLAVTLPRAGRHLTAPPCHPRPGPPAETPQINTKTVHVYVDPRSTDHQRALITAAMRRSWAGADGELVWDPASAAFRAEYCDGATVPAAAVPTLPYFFTFELDVPTDYPALLQEVQGMTGVVAVHRVPEQQS